MAGVAESGIEAVHDGALDDRRGSIAKSHLGEPELPEAPAAVQPPPAAEDPSKKIVDEVVFSDIGVNTLLNRLKQSVASARDFAGFLKKRASLEEEHSQGLKKLCRTTHDQIRRIDSRQGSYATHSESMIRINERMADSEMQFALSLHQMYEDLTELSNNMERGRKHWKTTGLANEKKAQDMELLLEKAKARYDSLAEDLDRVKTGDRSSGKLFGLKGPRNAAQHEDSLHQKLQAADSDYQAKVHSAQSTRSELTNSLRPQAVTALQQLITECDSAVTLQVQKFAFFSEKLLLANGMLIAPLPSGNEPPAKSLRDHANAINNEKDFKDHISSFHPKIPAAVNIKYEKHPTQISHQAVPNPSHGPVQPSFSQPGPQPQPQPQPQPLGAPTSSFGLRDSGGPPVPPPNDYPQEYKPQPQPLPPQQPDYQAYNSPVTSINNGPQELPSQQHSPPKHSSYPQQNYAAFSPATAAQPGPPQLNMPALGTSQYPSASAQQSPQQFHSNPAMGPAMGRISGGGANLPFRPVFGVSLDELYRRDGSPVPFVVYQCIQAVEHYGMEIEGIYRVNGTAHHIQEMVNMFNHDASKVDFRNPETFFHDVNSVASLLKQFFRDLPDPLLTTEQYLNFINAARIEDDVVRRDSLHAIINELPDPNYASLRALMMHLFRIQERSAVTRMTISNLSICFAPTLMGGNMSDAGLQARVIDTILTNCWEIFNDD